MPVVRRVCISEISSGNQIDDLLEGGVCFLIGGVQFGGRGVRLRGFAMEEAVAQGVRRRAGGENEPEGDAHGFSGETVGVALTVALE